MWPKVTAAELLSWLSLFCSNTRCRPILQGGPLRPFPRGDKYCNYTLFQSVPDCARDLSNHSQWPSAQANEATSRWFKNTSALFIGDSTISNKAYYLCTLGVQSACRPGTAGVCTAHARTVPCVWSTYTNRTDFDLVLWNIGLHHLHLEPSRHPPTALTFTEYLSTLRKLCHTAPFKFPESKAGL